MQSKPAGTGKPVEEHPLEPFLPANAKILMLGSFPPKRERWSMDFYYPNRQNDMWRIMGLVFFEDRGAFLVPDGKGFDEVRIRAFCAGRGIALSDTASSVIRHKDNASDQFLEVVAPVDLPRLLVALPLCRAIAVTGQKAADTLSRLTGTDAPPVGGSIPFEFDGRLLRIYRMPSSSRAYPKPIEEKAAVYRAMFVETGLL